MVPMVAVRWCVGAACSVVLLGTSIASAQTLQAWKGPYAGGFVGGGFQTGNASEIVRFDTNLDGAFTDVVRTVAGVDADRGEINLEKPNESTGLDLHPPGCPC